MTSAKIQVLVNGISGKEIVYRRGLRQRDPLSPLLFVLVADELNRMFDKANEVGFVTSLCSFSATKFFYCHYADDTFIFGQNDTREAILIRCILRYYEAWTRLKIHFLKSSVIPLGRMNLFIVNVLGCRQDFFFSHHLFGHPHQGDGVEKKGLGIAV